MKMYMEHINLHVRNINATAKFIGTAFPHFKIRFKGLDANNAAWMHIGDDYSYFAIYQATDLTAKNHQPYSGRIGFNHVGLVVDDTDIIRERLLKGNYRESTIENHHPARKRIYFFDPDGNDWEFVQYLSEDLTLRNDYSDAGAPLV